MAISVTVEEMKYSPHEGRKSLKMACLATCQAHKASRMPCPLRSGQKTGHGVLQLERGKKAADETEFSSGKERPLVPAPCCLLMFWVFQETTKLLFLIPHYHPQQHKTTVLLDP